MSTSVPPPSQRAAALTASWMGLKLLVEESYERRWAGQPAEANGRELFMHNFLRAGPLVINKIVAN